MLLSQDQLICPIPFIILPPRDASPFIDALCSDRTVLFNAIDVRVKNIQQNIFDIAIVIIKREIVDHKKPSEDDFLAVVPCNINEKYNQSKDFCTVQFFQRYEHR
jgi:hypothetical protein